MDEPPVVVGVPVFDELEDELEDEVDVLLDVVEVVLVEDEVVDVVPPVAASAPAVVPELEDDEPVVEGEEPRPPAVELPAGAGVEELPEPCTIDESGSEVSVTAVQLPAVELRETSQRPAQSKK